LIFLANKHILWPCNLYSGATYSPETTVLHGHRFQSKTCSTSISQENQE